MPQDGELAGPAAGGAGSLGTGATVALRALLAAAGLLGIPLGPLALGTLALLGGAAFPGGLLLALRGGSLLGPGFFT